MPVVFVAPHDEGGVCESAFEHGGSPGRAAAKIIAITSEGGNGDVPHDSSSISSAFPATAPLLSPILTVITAERLNSLPYRLVLRWTGYFVDRPRNLAKSVTGGEVTTCAQCSASLLFCSL